MNKMSPSSLNNLTDEFRFKKGTVPWNKGKTSVQISWLKGTKGIMKPNSGNFKMGHVSWTKGLSKELHPAFGKQKTLETRKKISQTKVGDKNPMWKGGITPINGMIRHSLEYRLWREAILRRDNFICQICSQRGGKLQVDHIKRFADYPELRFAIDNGRTLCVPCHKKTDTWGTRIKSIKISDN